MVLFFQANKTIPHYVLIRLFTSPFPKLLLLFMEIGSHRQGSFPVNLFCLFYIHT